jgi:hypothetical protein
LKQLLESAVVAPQATLMGEPLISDSIEIAAAYLFYLCRNHPFLDGNKRTPLAAFCFTPRSPLFEIALVLVRLDHVASAIVKRGLQHRVSECATLRCRLRLDKEVVDSLSGGFSTANN